MVLIRAANNNYYCLEVPVSAPGWTAADRTSAEGHHTCLQLHLPVAGVVWAMQDATYAHLDADKLLEVPGCRKHSVYKDSDGTLWCAAAWGSTTTAVDQCHTAAAHARTAVACQARWPTCPPLSSFPSSCAGPT